MTRASQRRAAWTLLAALTSLTVACTPDTSAPPDAAADPLDANLSDAGTDASLDAHDVLDAADAANPLDAAPETDGATTLDDAEVPVDTGGAPVDAGPDLDASLDATVPRDAAPFDATGCGTLVTEHPPVPSPHITQCDPVSYDSVPPTSGPHYPIWPAYGPYATAVPWGFLVHALEHGGVVVAYDCPEGCDADVAALVTHLDLLPADPLCARDVNTRVITVPSPGLGVRFAAAAWGWGLTSNCFDLDALDAFLAEHYAHGPEDTCADGWTDLTCPAPPSPPPPAP